MKRVIDVHAAQANFVEVLQWVESGDEVVITRSERRVAKLLPLTQARHTRTTGLFAGQITIKPGFDDVPDGFDFAE